MYNRMLSILTLASVFALSCFRLPNNSAGESSLRTLKQKLLPETGTEEAKTFIHFDPTSEETTTVTATTSEDMTGTQIQIAPGSLQISTTLVIEAGVDLSETSVASEISLSDDIQIQSASSGLIVRPAEEAELKTPLKISLPLPVAAGLRLNSAAFAIYSKYLDPASDKLVTGVIPVNNVDASIRFDDATQRDVVDFKGYFGSYWIVSLSRAIRSEEVPPVKETQEPIINKNQTAVITSSGIVSETAVMTTQAIATLSLNKAQLKLNESERKVIAQVDAITGIKTCSVDIYEKSTDLNGKSYDAAAAFEYSAAIVKTTAHTLTGRFRCLDSNGKSVLSAWADSISVPALSTVEPLASTSGYPTGSSSAKVLDVTVSGSDIVQYKFKVQPATESVCSSSAGYSAAFPVATHITQDFSALSDGSIALCVIGQSSSGVWQSESKASKVTWTKDTAAPSAVLSGAPSGTNSVTSLNVAVAGVDVAYYKYKLRGTADAACSQLSGYSSETAVSTSITAGLSSMADGAIQLCVLGRDASGNWQSETVATTADWIKDTLPSMAALSGAPSGSSSALALNVTVGGSDIAQYKFKIRENADLPCSNSSGYGAATAIATPITQSISSLADGSLQLCVIGQDTSGTWQLEGTATIASWTKDTSAPAAVINSAPTGSSNLLSLSVTISGSDVSHYKFKLRGTADSACSVSSGYSSETAVANLISNSLSAYSDQVLELCVIGRDAIGNWQAEASATTTSWTKDTSAPTATVSGVPSGTNNVTAPNITVAGTDVSHYKFKFRESADTACSNASGYSSEIAVATAITASIASLGDGTIELCVLGRDAAGNWQSAATTASWTKDAIAPTAVLSGAPTGASSTTSLNITVSGSGVTQYKHKVRGSVDAACTVSTGYSTATPVATPISDSISGLSDGTVEVCVLAMDASGNLQSPASYTGASWMKDTLAPTTTISGDPVGASNITALSISIGGANVVSYKYKIREAADTACSDATGYSGVVSVSTSITNDISALADGSFELCVIGLDDAGNWQAYGAASTASWIKDTAPPTAAISGEPTGTNGITSLNVTISGVDEYKFKIKQWFDSACSTVGGYSSAISAAIPITTNISGYDDGDIELCVIGKDSAGNWQLEASASIASWTKDALLPNPPTAFNISPRNGGLALEWIGGGGDITGFLVLKKAGSLVTDAPTPGLTYYALDTIGSSTVVYAAGATSLSDSSLTNGTRYYYKVFAYDAARNYTSGVSTSGRPVAFAPPSPDNLLFWTDAKYSDSLFTDDGCSTSVVATDETVGCWKDISLKSASLVQATGGNRPVFKTSSIYGNSGLRHNNIEWLRASGSNIPDGNLEHTLVYIGSFSNISTSGAIQIGSSGADSMIKFVGDSGGIVYAFGTNDLLYPAPTDTNPKLFFGTYNGINGTGSNRKFYINNTVVPAGGSNGSLGNILSLPSNPSITIGSNSSSTENLSGDAGEFLLYDKVLSISERVELSRYAWDKWNIPQIDVKITSLAGGIDLEWTDGLESPSYLIVRQAGSPPTFTPVNGTSYNLGAQGPDYIAYTDSPKAFTLTSPSPAAPGVTYHFAIYGNDGSNNYTPVVAAQATAFQGPSLSGIAENGQISLSWPSVPDASGYLIVRSNSGTITFSPTNGSTYNVGPQGSDYIAYKGTGISYVDTGLSNGTPYYYMIFAIDQENGYVSDLTTHSITPTP